MLQSISEIRKMSFKGGFESCMKGFRSAGVFKWSSKGSCFIEIWASSGLTTVIMVLFAQVSAVKVEGVLYLVLESQIGVSLLSFGGIMQRINIDWEAFSGKLAVTMFGGATEIATPHAWNTCPRDVVLFWPFLNTWQSFQKFSLFGFHV